MDFNEEPKQRCRTDGLNAALLLRAMATSSSCPSNYSRLPIMLRWLHDRLSGKEFLIRCIVSVFNGLLSICVSACGSFLPGYEI